MNIIITIILLVILLNDVTNITVITPTHTQPATPLKMLSLLLLLCLLFYSVDSCSTVFGSGVTLTGVCPNDTFTVPVGTTLDYSCSYSFSGTFVAYWNVSGNISTANTNPLPSGIISITANSDRSVLTINAERLLDIQCGLCDLTGPMSCFPEPQEFVGAESIYLIVFGK